MTSGHTLGVRGLTDSRRAIAAPSPATKTRGIPGTRQSAEARQPSTHAAPPVPTTRRTQTCIQPTVQGPSALLPPVALPSDPRGAPAPAESRPGNGTAGRGGAPPGEAPGGAQPQRLPGRPTSLPRLLRKITSSSPAPLMRVFGAGGLRPAAGFQGPETRDAAQRLPPRPTAPQRRFPPKCQQRHETSGNLFQNLPPATAPPHTRSDPHRHSPILPAGRHDTPRTRRVSLRPQHYTGRAQAHRPGHSFKACTPT